MKYTPSPFVEEEREKERFVSDEGNFVWPTVLTVCSLCGAPLLTMATDKTNTVKMEANTAWTRNRDCF
jgi:hypothetical protein